MTTTTKTTTTKATGTKKMVKAETAPVKRTLASFIAEQPVASRQRGTQWREYLSRKLFLENYNTDFPTMKIEEPVIEMIKSCRGIIKVFVPLFDTNKALIYVAPRNGSQVREAAIEINLTDGSIQEYAKVPIAKKHMENKADKKEG